MNGMGMARSRLFKLGIMLAGLAMAVTAVVVVYAAGQPPSRCGGG